MQMSIRGDIASEPLLQHSLRLPIAAQTSAAGQSCSRLGSSTCLGASTNDFLNRSWSARNAAVIDFPSLAMDMFLSLAARAWLPTAPARAAAFTRTPSVT